MPSLLHHHDTRLQGRRDIEEAGLHHCLVFFIDIAARDVTRRDRSVIPDDVLDSYFLAVIYMMQKEESIGLPLRASND